ncbi:SRR1-like protein isoform X1 [Pieris brassicae]|uniref:SRR1-like protein isoform X1 n=1 Tax=Pieris brassicae TaxID=7116 RepID=UPI001E65EA7B|nr:SRR1-like protein isoform X1 [Pieris brassicae]
MSNHKYDSDGFQIVASKKSFKNKSTKVPRQPSDFLKSKSFNIDIEKSYKKIISAVDVLKDCQFSKDLIKSVSNIVLDRQIVELVCFGLGSIGECNISRYQLALLLCLKDAFEIDNILVHDPIFSSQECDLLKRLKLTIIEKNSEGDYVISNQGVTIVYLPHCPKQLTNNFLWSNWNTHLENCILLCNSFTSLIENQLSRVLSESVPYIQNIFSYTTEVSLENNFVYKDIFNDTSIHYFPSDKLILAPVDFWLQQKKPEYKDTEEFITSLMIEKLNIV